MKRADIVREARSEMLSVSVVQSIATLFKKSGDIQPNNMSCQMISTIFFNCSVNCGCGDLAKC